MTDTAARKPRPRRTFSAFGDVRRMPSDYEIVTHQQNWTLRRDRAAAFEQNPSSAANLWFLTYRDQSPLQAEDWDAYRDPDALTYRGYVTAQAQAQATLEGALEAHANAGADAALPAGSAALLAALFTPSRFLCHGMQQVEAYIGYLAPSSYITNAAGFATADLLRRVTTVAYRTRELQLSRPETAAGTAERAVWQDHPAWQPARKAIEYALVSYDWGEAFTALNLVLGPTLDDVLLTQLGDVGRGSGDTLTWLLSAYLGADSQRRGRWSRALADLAVAQRPANRAVLAKWIGRWSARADEAAYGLGTLLETLPDRGVPAADVAAHARAARERFLAGLLDPAEPGPAQSAPPGSAPPGSALPQSPSPVQAG
ncbi:MAG TPA: toluene hydroxylase [Trebonia sp.]|nr:toluene hydroxylase [Trebonia sp.]